MPCGKTKLQYLQRTNNNNNKNISKRYVIKKTGFHGKSFVVLPHLSCLDWLVQKDRFSVLWIFFQNTSSHITHPNIRNHHITCENSKNNHPGGRRPHPSLRDHPDMAVGSDRAVTHRDRQVLDGVKSLLVWYFDLEEVMTWIHTFFFYKTHRCAFRRKSVMIKWELVLLQVYGSKFGII